MDVIADIICQAFEISKEDLCGGRRFKQIRYARHFFFYMCLYRSGIQDSVVASFKSRHSQNKKPWNRSSIIHGANNVQSDIKIYAKDKRRFKVLEAALVAYCEKNNITLAHSGDLICFNPSNISVA